MKISHKLFLTLVGYTALILVMTLLLARWSFQQGFIEFTRGLEQNRLQRVAMALIENYRDNFNSWDFLAESALNDIMRSPQMSRELRRPPPRDRRLPGPHRGLPPKPPVRQPGDAPIPPTALFNAEGDFVSGDARLQNTDIAVDYPLLLSGQKIGELRSLPAPMASNELAVKFIQQQFRTSVLIGVICLTVSILLAWGLTVQLLRPIRSLHENIGTLAKGTYHLPEPKGRKDELGELMRKVHQLADTLDKTRQAKNRWFASISHELRTPLTVLIGEIEVLQEGIRAFDKSSLSSLEQEARLLERLVADLYQLSLSEVGGLKYTFTPVDLIEIIDANCDALQPKFDEKKLTLHRPANDAIWCLGDYARLSQLILNLLNNSYLYTDSPGDTYISVVQRKDTVSVIVEDTAPGVSADVCNDLFEPLFRMDEARTRKGSGAGLGLAICMNIADAHGGKIAACPSEKGGLKVTLVLPLETERR